MVGGVAIEVWMFQSILLFVQYILTWCDDLYLLFLILQTEQAASECYRLQTSVGACDRSNAGWGMVRRLSLGFLTSQLVAGLSCYLQLM